MKHFVAISILLTLTCTDAASEIIDGEPLPAVVLDGEAGELYVVHEEVRYRAWSSEALTGKIFVLYHLAARHNIDKVNQAFIDTLDTEEFPSEHYQLVTILNIDDVFTLGGSMARRGFESSRTKRLTSRTAYVLDDQSKVRDTWGLEKKGSAVIIVDKEGIVLCHKDSVLTKQEITKFITRIYNAF
jgi:YtfJ family uncharacterized protein